MRYLIIITCCCFLFSCSDSFINHALKFEKLGDCSNERNPIKMTSNSNGERYEFVSCLDEDFDGKKYSVERNGDSILVSFPKTSDRKQAQFKLILDIDAKPRYGHIILDGEELTIVPYK